MRLSVFVVCLVAAPALADGTAARQWADAAASLVVRNETRAVAEHFHYPASYTNAEREDEVANVASGLSWLLSQLGGVTDPVLNTEAVSFYDVGIFGGTLAYWESRSPVNADGFIYTATFAKQGPGFLKVLLLPAHDASSPEIYIVGFGIPVDAPNAKTRAAELSEGLARHWGIENPPNFRELLEEQLRPTELNPTPP